MNTIAVDSSSIDGGVDGVGMNGVVADDYDGAGNLTSNGGRWSRKRDLRNRGC